MGLFCPAVVLEGLADVVLDVGSERAGAVVVLVVALAGVDVDEVVFDSTLDASRHVVIDGGKAGGYADRIILAELGAVGALRLGTVEVDAEDVKPVGWCVTGKNAVEAMLTKRACSTEADRVFVCLLCEDFLAGLWGVFVIWHS